MRRTLALICRTGSYVGSNWAITRPCCGLMAAVWWPGRSLLWRAAVVLNELSAAVRGERRSCLHCCACCQWSVLASPAVLHREPREPVGARALAGIAAKADEHVREVYKATNSDQAIVSVDKVGCRYAVTPGPV